MFLEAPVTTIFSDGGPVSPVSRLFRARREALWPVGFNPAMSNAGGA